MELQTRVCINCNVNTFRVLPTSKQKVCSTLFCEPGGKTPKLNNNPNDFFYNKQGKSKKSEGKVTKKREVAEMETTKRKNELLQ